MTQSYVDEYTGRRKLAERATVTAAQQQHVHAGSDTSSADAGSWLNAQQSQQQSSSTCMRAVTRRQRTQEAG